MVCPSRQPTLEETVEWVKELYCFDTIVEPLGYTQRADREIVSLPMLPSAGKPYTHSNTVGNVVWTVRERVLGRTEGGVWTPTLKPELGSFHTSELKRFIRSVKERLRRSSLPLSTDEFCATMRGQKRNRYLAAAKSLQTTPLRRCDGHPSIFIKPEKWHEWKPGRAISARDPRYGLLLGCFLKPLEHEVYRAIDLVYGAATIMKGYTPERRAAVISGHWAHFKDPVAVGQDFSKFDQHISVEALLYEHSIYLHSYSNDPSLQRLLAWQLRGRCYANCTDGKVRYSTEGGRMSGDMNTSLGNCIISAALVWAYAQEHGITIRAVIDGDDSVTFMERRDLERYQAGIVQWMRKRGFILKMEQPVYNISQVEFCQCRFSLQNTPTMVRNPLKAITHDHLWVKRAGLEHSDVLAATGLGGLSLYGGVPVLGAYYRMLSKASPNGLRTLRRMDRESTWLREAGYSGKYTEPSEADRYALWESWGIAPEEQREMERYFDSTDLCAISNRQRSYDHHTHTTQVYFPSLLQFNH